MARGASDFGRTGNAGHCRMKRVRNAAGGFIPKRVFISSVLVLYFAAFLLTGEEWCSALASDDDEWDHGEAFSENLFLRPLPDGKVLSHFYFKNTLRNLGSAAHHHVFPKAISQLVKKFHISEMELSFTQGRWNYERWGALDPIASANAKPVGVELWAAFDVPLELVDPTWRNLTHALSGLFCASINFLETPAMMAAPEFALAPDLGTVSSNAEDQFTTIKAPTNSKGKSGVLRYGALPREAVCTENLTPWLKLLPCRDKAGISSLLDRPSIYRGYYHSLRVHLLSGNSRSNSGAASGRKETILEQTLTLVLQPSQPRERSSSQALPHWSLSTVFGRLLEGSCPLAKTSHVLLELEGSLVDSIQALDPRKQKALLEGQSPDTMIGRDSVHTDVEGENEISVADNAAFNLSPYPDRVYSEAREIDGSQSRPSLLLEYSLDGYSRAHPLNLGMLWKKKVSWPSVCGPFRVSRFLVGSGNQKGSIVIELKSNDQNRKQELVVDDALGIGLTSAVCDTVDVSIFHMVPWYVRLYTHTLTALVDGYQLPLWEVATRMRIVPAEDRLSPATLEIQLRLPTNISILSLNVEFDKGFLHIDEHPPDANRGFDLPSALISFPTSGTQKRYRTSEAVSTENGSPFLQTLQDAGPVHIYSESLLVQLATPDFSMPYNVITFTCTILALYFGSLLNTLRRRIGEEERRLAKSQDRQQGKLSQLFTRYMEGKSETQKKLIKMVGVVGVAAIAIVANYLLNVG